MPKLGLWLMLFLLGCRSATAQSFTDFQPSALQSPHGQVSQVEYQTGFLNIGAGYIAHAPSSAARMFRFEEPVWIIGYQTFIYDTEGAQPEENYLCHTYLGDERFTQHHTPRQNAIYSDAFTREVRLPSGFGLYVAAAEDLTWLPLFNNRTSQDARVAMRIEITLIREKDLKKPLRRLYSTLWSVKTPHLFFVPPGQHEQQITLRFDFEGSIHFMGTHIHPYGESMELYNLSREERVWKGEKQVDQAGKMIGFDVYSNGDGYSVGPRDTYQLKSVYDNSTDQEIDAMAGLFVFYSLEPSPTSASLP